MPRRAIDPVLLILGGAQTIIALGTLTAWFFTPLYVIITPTYSVSIMPWGITIRTGTVVKTLDTNVTLTILVLLIIITLTSLAGTLLRRDGLFIIALGTSTCTLTITSLVIYTITLLVSNIPVLYWDNTLVLMLFILTVLATANGTHHY
jgi:hypothetical protein